MSTRLEYRISDLQRQVQERCDREVAQAEQRRDEALRLTERRNRWRVEQEQRVVDLAERITTGEQVADTELEAFTVAGMPRADRWHDNPEKRRREDVAKAEADRNRRLGRLASVRAFTPAGESEPVVSLTPNMLNDWLGL